MELLKVLDLPWEKMEDLEDLHMLNSRQLMTARKQWRLVLDKNLMEDRSTLITLSQELQEVVEEVVASAEAEVVDSAEEEEAASAAEEVVDSEEEEAAASVEEEVAASVAEEEAAEEVTEEEEVAAEEEEHLSAKEQEQCYEEN